MGLFDYAHAVGPEFVCDQGHPIVEMQTKDLGSTMGGLVIEDNRATFRDGGWGDPPAQPLSLTISVYGSCDQCPAFVQAKSHNMVDLWVEFDVEVDAGRVVSVTRVSETLDEFLTRKPKEPWMADCVGPLPHKEAYALRMKRLREWLDARRESR